MKLPNVDSILTTLLSPIPILVCVVWVGILPVIAYCITLSILLTLYRLVFHPIAHFPGPKLAGLTRWYEFYYEIVQKGQMTFHIQELHKKYGGQD
jgi:hypothetical protein